MSEVVLVRFFKRVLREPLLHFLAIGLILFGGSALLGPGADPGGSRRRIEVTGAEVKWLKESFEARWQRPPTATELRGLVDNFVREEVLYREALAVGLDRNDDVIRRRMVQKIELMTEDLAAQQPPTEAELEAYFRENLDEYRSPEGRRFRQIYFNVDRRRDDAAGAARQLLEELRSSPDADSERGDRFLLEYEDRPLSEVEIERLFGKRFAEALFAVEPGAWHGPIRSSYGLHLVRVDEVREGGAPELAVVRAEVLLDYAAMIRRRTRDAMYSSLAKRYEIEVDDAAIRALSFGEADVR